MSKRKTLGKATAPACVEEVDSDYEDAEDVVDKFIDAMQSHIQADMVEHKDYVAPVTMLDYDLLTRAHRVHKKLQCATEMSVMVGDVWCQLVLSRVFGLLLSPKLEHICSMIVLRVHPSSRSCVSMRRKVCFTTAMLEAKTRVGGDIFSNKYEFPQFYLLFRDAESADRRWRCIGRGVPIPCPAARHC